MIKVRDLHRCWKQVPWHWARRRCVRAVAHQCWPHWTSWARGRLRRPLGRRRRWALPRRYRRRWAPSSPNFTDAKPWSSWKTTPTWNRGRWSTIPSAIHRQPPALRRLRWPGRAATTPSASEPSPAPPSAAFISVSLTISTNRISSSIWLKVANHTLSSFFSWWISRSQALCRTGSVV